MSCLKYYNESLFSFILESAGKGVIEWPEQVGSIKGSYRTTEGLPSRDPGVWRGRTPVHALFIQPEK